MNQEIKRDYYLEQMANRRQNGLIKVVTGIRKCGKSYFLRTIFKNHLLGEGVKADHIIEMSFEHFDKSKYRDPNVFDPWAKEQIKDNDTYYFLLDEVQLLGEYAGVLIGLAERKNCDVYVTSGSPEMLPGDIEEGFAGKCDEVRMLPLSFSEFMSVYEGDYRDGWNEYITYGGIPLVVLARTEEQKIELLQNLAKETFVRDVAAKNKVRNAGELETLYETMSLSVGSLINPNKLQKTFKNENNSNITATTVTKYIEYLKASLLVEEAKRFDIRAKSYIGTPMKYYFADLGLCNVKIDFRQLEAACIMENVIYNEFRMRGYRVDIGSLTIVEQGMGTKPVKKQLEVDFVASMGSKKYYLQTAYMIDSKEKSDQMTRTFRWIKDSFKKILVTWNTPKPFYNEEGVLVMNVFDLLLHPEMMEY